jgi:hypothetical protein
VVGVTAVLALPRHYRSDVHTANEAARIYAALALVDHGTARLDPVFDRYFPGWRQRPRPPNYDVARRHGHYYLDKAPGVSLLAVPVIAALRAGRADPAYASLAGLLTLLLSALPLGLALAFVRQRLARDLGDGRALLLAAALVLATPLLAYGGLLFGHALAAGLVAVGLLLALGPLGPAEEARPARSAALGGLALGAAVLVEYPAAGVALLAFLALALDPVRRRRLPWLVLGGLGPALALAAWHTLVFGHPLALPYGFKASPDLAATHAAGLWGLRGPSLEALHGLLLGSRRGLLPLAPWLALGLVGAVAAAGQAGLARAWRALLPAAAVLVPLLVSGFADWHGGRLVGPRYLAFWLPVPVLGLAVLLGRGAPGRAGAWVAPLGLGLVGSATGLALVLAFGFPYVSERLVNPVFEVVIPVLLRGGPARTWLGTGSGAAVAVILAAVAVAGLLAVALRRAYPALADPRGPGLPVAVALGLLAAGIHLAAASLPVTPGPRGQVRVLEERALAHEHHGQTERARTLRRAAAAHRAALASPGQANRALGNGS